MKKRLLSFAVITLSLCIFSATSFAQTDTGGTGTGGTGGTGTGSTGDGGGTISVPYQPLGYDFTRNNGDGTCGGEAQIRLYYTTMPAVAPVLDQIYYNGAPLFSNYLPVTGDYTTFASFGYVSFCLAQSNIPPAVKLDLTYTPGGTCQPDAQISGTQ